MVAALSYAVTVNFVPAYRDVADKIGDSTIGIVNREDEESVKNLDVEKREEATLGGKETTVA